MYRNLDIGTLRSLLAVIDSGGVTRAANRLHLTQSAVSMQIKRLEEALDLALLDRSGRGVKPTAEGEQLATYARKMIALNDSAIERMVAPQFEGEVSLGLPCDLIYPHAPKVLRRFDADFPRVNVRFVSSYTTSLLRDFRDGKLDVIVTTEDHPDPDAETIVERPLQWYGAIGGRAWAERPLRFASATHCSFRPITIRAMEAAGIPWENGVVTEHDDAALAAVSADMCVTTLLGVGEAVQIEPVPGSARLPDLPVISCNLYCATDTQNAGLAKELARYVKDAFAG
jgi:DNA-binding transcriptional LysR family regulator